MNRCEFEPTAAPGEYRCRHCGALRRSSHGAEKIHRWCDRIRLSAEHPRIERTHAASRGIGDTVTRLIDMVTRGRGHRWAAAAARRLGHDDCGCGRRRQWLNRALPYGTVQTVAPDGPRPALLLRMPHGLGDAVQMTVVLRHLRHYHPDWQVDVAAKVGADTLFAGLCRRAYLLGQEPGERQYTVARTLAWDEPADCYADSPATKAERCLREVFQLRPIDRLCRYQIQVSQPARRRCQAYLASICPGRDRGCQAPDDSRRYPVVLFHYQGNSALRAKMLDEELVAKLVRRTLVRGLVPVVLDWDRRQALSGIAGVHSPGAEHPLWRATGTGDGETLAGLIGEATAMLAIDSGPGHVAGATDTPALVVWRGHHPLNYYALAPNVRHAVPVEHRSLLRGADDRALAYFEKNYDYRRYSDLRQALPRMFDELLDDALGRRDELTVDADLWVRRRHLAADRIVAADVYVEDCYGVDQLAGQPRYVVDVGAHLGAFACRIRRRLAGAGRIVCVEADRRNLPALARNVGGFAEIVAAACTYAPRPVRLRSTVYDGTDNTGGSWIGSGGEIVPRVTLEEILAAYQLPQIDVLKLDCEGSELSILANSSSLERVRCIVGEWHDREQFLRLIARRLPDWRFEVLRDGPRGLFRLENPRA